MEQLSEAINLSEEILKNIELSEAPLENIILKATRLCRLLNDEKSIKHFLDLSVNTTNAQASIENANVKLAGLKGIVKAQFEDSFLQIIESQKKILNKIKLVVYSHTSKIYYQLKYSSVPRDIFEKIRIETDKTLAELVPEAVKKFVSIYSNIRSSNPEDLSNAVHSCRRILKAVADKLYPPNPNDMKEISINGKSIKVGPGNYINRLMVFIDNNSDSIRYKEIIGSHLRYLGDRIDSIYSASTKGSHIEINSLEEAERYIIFTYLLIGDVLRLCKNT